MVVAADTRPAAGETGRQNVRSAPSGLALARSALSAALIGGALCGDGCASPRAAGPPGVLVVLHVRGERECGAAFPIAANRVITATSVLWPGFAAVIDSVPMDLTKHAGRLRHPGPPAPNSDWVVLGGVFARYRPNVIDPAVELRAGDRVMLGGFRANADALAVPRFLSVPATIIVARVTDPPASGERAPVASRAPSPASLPQAGADFTASDEVVWVSAPHGDYRAFLGGPAATLGADGIPHVWGVITKLSGSSDSCPQDAGSILGVTRLPMEEFAEPVQN